EQTARAEAERSQQQAAFLAEAARVLAFSLEDQAILQGLVRVAVPFLGDWCGVHTRAEDGSIRQLIGAHADIARTYRAWESGRSSAQRVAASEVAARVIHTSQSALYPEHPGAAHPGGPDPNPTGKEVASGMCVPLLVEGQTVGAVSFEVQDSG